MTGDDQSEEESKGESEVKSARLPYIEAIREIEKIEEFTCPAEMVSCLSNSFEKLKTAVVDFHKGKIELSAMDDVLPLSIYVVSVANLQTPASHKNMMEDYLRAN